MTKEKRNNYIELLNKYQVIEEKYGRTFSDKDRKDFILALKKQYGKDSKTVPNGKIVFYIEDTGKEAVIRCKVEPRHEQP